jgi:hypothetical protein
MLEKRVAALEATRQGGEALLPGFCPIQEDGETDDAFRERVTEIRAANPGHKVIPMFVIDGSVPEGE